MQKRISTLFLLSVSLLLVCLVIPSNSFPLAVLRARW
jgi:hypothetical protein